MVNQINSLTEQAVLDGKKGVLLDLDNTLYLYAPCHAHALGRCFEQLNEELIGSFDIFCSKYADAQKAVKVHTKNQGSCHSRFLYFQRFFEQLRGKTDFQTTIAFEELYWKSFFEKMELFDGVIAFLQQCKERNILVCIVSDLTAKIQFEKICHLNIESYIDLIVSSEEAGREKPYAPIYTLALEKMRLKPEDVVMIGDDLHKDGQGAEALGIQSYIFLPMS